MALAASQGLVKSRFNGLSAERLILIGLLFISFLLCLWGISPWIQYRNFLSIHIPKTTKANALIANTPKPIEQSHLFGLYVQDYAHLPITTLALSLQGTLINPGNKYLSTAIISASGEPAKLYHINDQLPVGAKIIAIHKDYCVLDHGGRLEKLIIPRVTLQNSPALSQPGSDSGLKVVS
jgi:hypothetical protein